MVFEHSKQNVLIGSLSISLDKKPVGGALFFHYFLNKDSNVAPPIYFSEGN
jgi:hypothetical protein